MDSRFSQRARAGSADSFPSSRSPRSVAMARIAYSTAVTKASHTQTLVSTQPARTMIVRMTSAIDVATTIAFCWNDLGVAKRAMVAAVRNTASTDSTYCWRYSDAKSAVARPPSTAQRADTNDAVSPTTKASHEAFSRND